MTARDVTLCTACATGEFAPSNWRDKRWYSDRHSQQRNRDQTEHARPVSLGKHIGVIANGDLTYSYLYRREDPDSGGAGLRRCGNGGRLAYLVQKGDMAVGLYAPEGIPKTPGLVGGLPGNPGDTRLLRNRDVLEQSAAGKLPASVHDLSGESEQVYGKGAPFAAGRTDVLEWNWGACAGYGDPLVREGQVIAADVSAGSISVSAVRAVGGVVLEGQDVDGEGTLKPREQMRRERLRSGGVDGDCASPRAARPAGALAVGADVCVDTASGMYRCHRCGSELGRLAESFKEGLVVHECGLQELGPRFSDPATLVDETIVWREFVCPGCGRRPAAEVARPADQPLVEFILRLDA